MAMNGIDAVVYGVADMAECRRHFSDWGLRRKSSSARSAVFATEDGCEVVLRPMEDKTLPPPIEDGPTVREIVWGVTAKADLARIARELGKDREVAVGRDGVVRSTDDLGLGIAFRKTVRKRVPDRRQPMNALGGAGRVDARATYHERARPTHVGHCVFMAPDIRRMEAFYVRRLGFHVSDYYKGRGVFLRAAPRGGHHNLFYLESADDRPAINHVAFGVQDVHELFAGGSRFQSLGHSVQIGPGRHHISSCYFWYFDCPAGGATEYFCDEDFLTENWKPGHWDPAPETFAEWVLADGLARGRAQPPTREKRDMKRHQKPRVRQRADAGERARA